MNGSKVSLAGQQTTDEFLRVLDGVLQRLTGNTENLNVKNMVHEVVAQVRAEIQAEPEK